jgi:hypothetical protein
MRWLFLVALLINFAGGCRKAEPQGSEATPGSFDSQIEPYLPQPYRPPEDEYDPSPSSPVSDPDHRPIRGRIRERLNERSKQEQK